MSEQNRRINWQHKIFEDLQGGSMDKHTIELTHSQWMALTALVAQHLQCQEKLDEYMDCSQEPEVVTRPEELLALLMSK